MDYSILILVKREQQLKFGALYFVVVTGAVNFKAMEDYLTTSFLLGFIRFAWASGYLKMLMPDEGSQLMKGCIEMQLDFYGMQFKLNGLKFEACQVGGHNIQIEEDKAFP